MIKKSIFENEIIANMQYQLQPSRIKEANNKLASAVDYLESAIGILEEAGLTASADQILEVLATMSDKPVVLNLPSVEQMMEQGLSLQDFEQMNDGDIVAKSKINKALRNLGYSDKEIISFLGTKNFVREKDIDAFLNPESPTNKILDLIKNPLKDKDDEFTFSSLATHKPKDPRKISDPHTKGLTSEKMVKNLLHHGTEFNMADDGQMNDLLDLDVSDEDLEVLENDILSEMNFEDEI